MTAAPPDFLPAREGEFLLQTLAPEPLGRPARQIWGAAPLEWLRGRIHDPAALDRLKTICASRSGSPGGLVGTVDYSGAFCFGLYDTLQTALTPRPAPPPLPAGLSGGPSGPVTSAPDRAAYRRMVLAAKEEIAAGNIYQVNLARRFAVPWRGDPAPLYAALARRSPAPFAALIRQPGRAVLSASPELFFRVSGGAIETRPIKGTRPRGRNPEEDRRLRAELEASPKERAELVMITDLLRNDLGRVCAFGSVRADRIAEVETFAQVHHLVSTVTGRLAPDAGPLGALAALFPGGSITGAPKLRAISVIAALEPFDRGLFTGAVGFVTFSGEAVFSIAIRAAVHTPGPGAAGGLVVYHAGSGIVADSDPDAEFDETEAKAAGFLLAVRDLA